MKLNSNELYSSLSFLRDIIPQSSHMPTFAYVHLSKTTTGVLFRGMDTGKYAEIEIEAVEFEDNFPDTLVPMTKFYDFIGDAKKVSEHIKFVSGQKSLEVILDDSSTAKIPVIDAKEFPDKPSTKTGVEFNIESEDMLLATHLAKLTGSQYIVTQSIHLFTTDGKLYSEATNGFSGGRVVVQDNMSVTFDVILMADFARIIVKSAKMFTGTWDVTITKNHFTVRVADKAQVSYAIGAEKYPQTDNLYKNDAVSVVSLNTQDLTTNLNMIKTLSDTTNTVVFTIKNKVLTVCTDGSSDGSRSYEIPVGSVEDNVVKVDVLELRKVLSMVDGDTVHFQIGKKQPILIFDDDVKKQFFVVPQL